MKVPRQPEVNIGMVGHVDHGKTMLTKALTQEWTDRHSEEIKRGISIRLGYADAVFYKCPKCKGPDAYNISAKCENCGGEAKIERVVSFVDSPGHETLMATMLSGAAIMDGALLLIAANEKCPQPQTKEHLMALSIIGVKNIVIVQNKIDIVDDEAAQKSYNEIKEFVKGTAAENAPIIPFSAHHDANLDYLIYTLEKTIPTPEFNKTGKLRMYVARSFDINHPGDPPKKIKGGVFGGTILQGTIKIGDEIEISPGISGDGLDRKIPIRTKVISLFSGGESQKEAGPGGLIAVGTELDPAITKSDSITGRMAGKPGSLPPVLSQLEMEFHLLDRVVGTSEDLKVDTIKTNEPLMLNVGTATTVGVVKGSKKGSSLVNLKLPICAEKGQRIAVSRRIGGKWRLIGYGVVK